MVFHRPTRLILSPWLMVLLASVPSDAFALQKLNPVFDLYLHTVNSLNQSLGSVSQYLFDESIEQDEFQFEPSLGLSDTRYKHDLHKFLTTRGLPQNISIVRSDRDKVNPSGSVEVAVYDFTYRQQLLCQTQMQVWSFADQTKPVLRGTIPLESPDFIRHSKIETIHLKNLIISLDPDMNLSDVQLLRNTPCLMVYEGIWHQAREVVFQLDGLSYLAYMNHHKIFSIQKKYFAADGTLQFYSSNPLDGTLKTETFNLSGDGYLTTDKVQTEAGDKTKVFNESLNFVKSPDEDGFPEINTFAHILKIIEWFEALGFSWNAGEILTLKLHQNSNRNVGTNNALYLPAEFTGASNVPSILLGDGDGSYLQNLPLDRDVPSHEFGHHVVYQTMKSTDQKETRGEGISTSTDHSGAIHEGVADYFIFAMTEDQNACLGESICPGGDKDICYQKGQCLRTAVNEIQYDSDTYWSFNSVHLKGQIVSGLLWDIRKDPETDASQFDQLVLKSIDFFAIRSTYKDLIAALFTADQKYFQSTFSPKIEYWATQRGFSEIVNELNPAPTNQAGTRSKTFGCGVLGSSTASRSPLFWLIMMMFLIPAGVNALICFFRRSV